jgi:hypothetical protein
MSDSPEGKYYVGYAYNKETETESDNPADYVWALFRSDADQGDPGPQGDPAPSYRGITEIADTGNTGTITLAGGGQVAMRNLDWVLFMGTADWTKARLYQWHKNESVWTMLEPADNPMQYMEILKDIAAEDAPDGIFSNVFCQALFAQQAAIDTLQSRLIQIQNAIFGGEWFAKSGESVVDNGEDKAGFMLGADGVLKASGAQISGTVNAGSGTFTGAITPSVGIYNSWYWGVAVDKTQNDWFQIFKDRIEIGKRLNIFGGAVVKNETTGNFVTGIFCFIERLDVDTIELNLFPISGDSDRMLIAKCVNGNANVVTRRYYIGW